MELYAKEFGQGKPVFILHGLFGFSDNWQTIAKALSDHYLVVTPDLRNHGRSPHVSTHSYPHMAEDLRAYMEHHWMFNATLIGHSMGGKVAMQMALHHPDLVERLVVVDMAPGPSKSDHNGIFEALFAVDISRIQSRKEAEDFLAQHISDNGTLQFLLKNITRNVDGSYSWKMNLPVLHQSYQHILAPVEGPPFDKPALFIRGERSDYVKDQDWPAIQALFPQAKLVTIPNAGHWVHADQPLALLETVRTFLHQTE